LASAISLTTRRRCCISWQRIREPGGPDNASFAELIDVTQWLCLPAERADDVAAALVEARVDAERSREHGSSGREVVTIW